MPFLTIFSAPKAFTDAHITTIQCNAIRSWLSLGEDVEAILVGDEPGMAEAARQLGVRQLTSVRRNDKGTPLVSSIFDQALQASQAPVMAYLNADILVMPDFVEATKKVSSLVERFLIIGQRWDLDVRHELDFGAGWVERLRGEVRARGRLHPPAGSDYFIFPRGLYHDMPDFAIGRAGWDNWTIYHARSSGWPVVDATPTLMVVHQDHDYDHLPEGKPHYDVDESRHNQVLAGGMAHMYMVLDADKELRKGRLHRHRSSLLRVVRNMEVHLMPEGERRGARWALARRFRRLRRSMSGSL